MAASLMRQHFDRYLKDPQDRVLADANGMTFLISKAGLTMCLWYGMLFVVIEGWRESKLSDPVIDDLLKSPNVQSLKQFRNGMFHYQKGEWLAPKMHLFFDQKVSPNSVTWVLSLTAEFRRYFLAEMKRISAKPAAP